MKKTLYDVLEIDRNASLEQITAAYQARKAAFINAADNNSLNELRLIQQAFVILSDSAQRNQYDQKLNTEISRRNSVIYYSKGSSPEGRRTVRLALLLLVSIAGTAAYLHYSNKAPAAQPDAIALHDGAPSASQYIRTTATTFEEIPESKRSRLHDVSAVPYLTEEGKAHYLEFLSHPSPRAFVICESGRYSISYGFGRNVLHAAMKNAAQFTGDNCRPYAVNDEVVWQG